MNMFKILTILLFICSIFFSSVFGSSDESGNNFEKNQIFATPSLTDSNVAFYEGIELSYIFRAPGDLILLIDEPIRNGYSLAFVENNLTYDLSEIRIDITIIDVKNSFKDFNLSKFISAELKEIKMHFGELSEISFVDSVLSRSMEKIPTFFINNPGLFIPNVMIAYFSDDQELIIFELSIKEGYPRFEAEKIFIQLLQEFKSLKKKEKDKLAEKK